MATDVTSVPEPMGECWVHPGVEVRPSRIQGLGLFAAETMSQDTVLERLGGRLVSTSELEALIAASAREPGAPYVDTITVAEDIHLAMPSGSVLHYGNHSCDPNAWHIDAYTIAARRPVFAGEEITVDYATQSGLPDWWMACSCGTNGCRGTISGEDWRRPELQARYGEHWVPLLRDLILNT